MTPVEQMAVEYHKRTDGKGEGEYGCNGLTCPGVQRLVTFAQAVYDLAVSETRQQIQSAIEQSKRYDKVTNYRCGESIDELEPADDGEWMRVETVVAAIRAASSPPQPIEK